MNAPYNPSIPDPFVEMRDRDLPCGNCSHPEGEHSEIIGCEESGDGKNGMCPCLTWVPEEEADQ